MDSPQASSPTQTTALSTASFCWRCDARELGRVPDPQFTNLSSPVHVRGSAGGLSQRFIGHGQGPVGGSVLRPRPQYSKPLSGTLHGSPSRFLKRSPLRRHWISFQETEPDAGEDVKKSKQRVPAPRQG
jgi:hypothetical protein